jgi:hypothetical protein
MGTVLILAGGSNGGIGIGIRLLGGALFSIFSVGLHYHGRNDGEDECAFRFGAYVVLCNIEVAFGTFVPTNQ